jgi:hypothetical protein
MKELITYKILVKIPRGTQRHRSNSMKINLNYWSGGGILRLLNLALHFHKRRKLLVICGFVWVLRSEIARLIVAISSMILSALLLSSVFKHICRLLCAYIYIYIYIYIYLMWKNKLYFSLQMDEKLNNLLPAALCPKSRLSPLREKRVAGISLGVKGGRCVQLTTLPPSCADYVEIIRA